jgi:hypothetical protein
MTGKTTNQVTPPEKRNPNGKGGFGDNPQNRNDGRWKKENSISYQYHRFLAMDPIEWPIVIEKEKSEGIWTVAMDLAYRRVLAAKDSLADVKEITDRTEGKAPQSIDLTSQGNELKTALVEFVGGDGTDQDKD